MMILANPPMANMSLMLVLAPLNVIHRLLFFRTRLIPNYFLQTNPLSHPIRMGCKINSFYLTIPGKSSVENLPKNNPAFYFSPFYCKNEAGPASSTAVTRRADLKVDFQTLGACKLGIARYPDFEYDARGGKGRGLALQPSSKDDNDEILVSFDLETVYIPPLTSVTTKFLGLPLPPFLRIDIVPELFRGNIGRESGKVYLRFKAKFCFSVGSIYRAPPLIVETVLTSEESNGKMRGGRGERLDEEGNCRLVGVATVEPIDDVLMNSFLGLPTECLAILSAVISLSS